MSTCLVEVKDLTKSFKNLLVIDKLSIRLEKGKVYLLKGENGTGKTTFIKLILGFYKPNKGTIRRFYKNFRYVAELLPFKSDLKVNTYLNSLLALMKEKRDSELESYLQLELNKRLKNLSKGNVKKVLLYLAFVGNPEIVFLDEPLDGLDAQMQKKVVSYLKERPEICYLISSHNTKNLNSLKNKEVITFD